MIKNKETHEACVILHLPNRTPKPRHLEQQPQEAAQDHPYTALRSCPPPAGTDLNVGNFLLFGMLGSLGSRTISLIYGLDTFSETVNTHNFAKQ